MRAAAFGVLVLLTACGREAADDETATASVATPAAAPAAPAPEPAIQSPVLEARGYGTVKTGMSEAEAREALGPGVNVDPGGPESCRHMWLGEAPADVIYMLENGKVARVTAHRGAKIRTDKGLGLGATEAQVRAAYGDGLTVEPHKYLGPTAKYLTAWVEPDRLGVSYVTNEAGIVEEIHAGGPAIQYVEGCS